MVILKSLDEQIQIQITEGQNLLLGRLLKCDVVLEDTSISSQHARLKLKEGHLRVVDLGSTNGTRLNYSLLTAPGYLQDGDTIEFGNVTFVVDGPELSIPDEYSLSAQTLGSLEHLDSSQKLADTMVSLELSEDELAETETETGEDVLGSEGHENTPHAGEPVHAAFLAALILILIGSVLLLVHLWNIPPQI